jgi:DNA-binding NarL/FixJ family response regulator
VATGELSPDVVLMDLRMPRDDPQGGIRAIRQIADRYPQVKVLALTESDDETDVRAAALAGAIGYIVKSVKAAQIAEAVRAAHAGKGWLDPSVTAYLLHDYRRASQELPTPPALTPTELRVLQLAAAGQTTLEIADELFVAEKTVKNHLTNIYRKLGVKNRSHAVSEGYRQGLLK